MSEITTLYRLPQVIAMTGFKRSSIYNLIKTGAFPRPVRLGLRAVAWRSHDIHGWIESRQQIERVGACFEDVQGRG